MKYAIYKTALGVATARPVSGLIEVSDLPTDDFAAQVALLYVGESYIQVPDDAEFDDLDDDEDTYDYTVDTTAVPPVTMTPVTVARYSLVQRQAVYRAKRDDLISRATALTTFGRLFSDGEAVDWLDYLEDLKALADEPANPEAVVFPTQPTEVAGTASDPIWTRLYRRGNVLGTVGLTLLGTPTGALIDYGSTANGRYAKFTDGTLIQSHRTLLEYDSATQLRDTWTFPHAFGPTGLSLRNVQGTMSNKNNSNGTTANQITNVQISDGGIFWNSFTGTTLDMVFRCSGAAFGVNAVCWIELLSMGRWD